LRENPASGKLMLDVTLRNPDFNKKLIQLKEKLLLQHQY